jgi:acyl-CoA reductase-like NAD-dependent aldehyde dehydrogenase
MWFDHHATLELPEEVVEDDEKVITTRYTPLGVVGAIIPCMCRKGLDHGLC